MAVSSQKLSTTYTIEDTKRSDFESTHLENLRRQVQAHMEKEKAYKHEISELQQQLSRR